MLFTGVSCSFSTGQYVYVGNLGGFPLWGSTKLAYLQSYIDLLAAMQLRNSLVTFIWLIMMPGDGLGAFGSPSPRCFSMPR